MHNLPHPGEIIREQCVEPLGLTITAVSKGLGVTSKALSELVNGHSGGSPEYRRRMLNPQVICLDNVWRRG